MEDERYYYWLDTDYHYGDYSVPKLALYRGEYDDDRTKMRDTEEVLCWATYEDLGIDPHTEDDAERNNFWGIIDSWILDEIDHLPFYQIN